MTVREAFAICYLGVPEGPIHLAWDYDCKCAWWCVWPNGCSPRYFDVDVRGMLYEEDEYSYLVIGPDISDRPASSFIGFFGHEYDKAVEGGK